MINKLFYSIFFIFITVILFAQEKYITFNAGITFNNTTVIENANGFFYEFQPREGESPTLEPGFSGEINFGRQYEKNSFELGFGILDTQIKIAATDANGLVIHGNKYQWINIPFRYYRTLLAKKWVNFKIGAEVSLLSRTYGGAEFTTCSTLNGVTSSCSTIESKNYQSLSIGIGPVSTVAFKLFDNIYLNLWYYQIWRPGRGYDYTIVTQELTPDNSAILQEHSGLFNPSLSTSNFGIGLTFYRNAKKVKTRKEKKSKKKPYFIHKQTLRF